MLQQNIASPPLALLPDSLHVSWLWSRSRSQPSGPEPNARGAHASQQRPITLGRQSQEPPTLLQDAPREPAALHLHTERDHVYSHTAPLCTCVLTHCSVVYMCIHTLLRCVLVYSHTAPLCTCVFTHCSVVYLCTHTLLRCVLVLTRCPAGPHRRRSATLLVGAQQPIRRSRRDESLSGSRIPGGSQRSGSNPPENTQSTSFRTFKYTEYIIQAFLCVFLVFWCYRH